MKSEEASLGSGNSEGIASERFGKAAPFCGDYHECWLDQRDKRTLHPSYIHALFRLQIQLSKNAPAKMPQMSSDRNALTARSIPHMILSTGEISSMTGPPPPMPHYISAEGRAVRRFAVEGVAIRTSSYP